MTLKPIFRSSDGTFAVFPCSCGCDQAVKVTPDMERENVRRGYYVAHHAPIGCAYERKGQAYDFIAQEAPISPAIQSDALTGTDDWGETTPVTQPRIAFDGVDLADLGWSDDDYETLIKRLDMDHDDEP